MTLVVRELRARDVAAVERIYRAHVEPGRAEPPGAVRARLAEALAAPRAIALAGVDEAGRVVGYLLADVRRWEFGSEPAGWIFALGVDQAVARHGLGRMLLDAAVARFAAAGVHTVRTMVRRDDVPVLRFFRSGHFTAGPYQELELRPEGGAP
jgi:ribosomal protein S18 acetylase RimI-like enzyme